MAWLQKLVAIIGLLLGIVGAIAAIFLGIPLVENCNESLKNYDFITPVFIIKVIFYLIPISGVIGLIGLWLQRGNGALVVAGSVLLVIEAIILIVVPFALGAVVDDFLGAGTSQYMDLESVRQVLIAPVALSLAAGVIGFCRFYFERKEA